MKKYQTYLNDLITKSTNAEYFAWFVKMDLEINPIEVQVKYNFTSLEREQLESTPSQELKKYFNENKMKENDWIYANN
ncbi:hypothetical protein ACWCQ1_51730 [Streptomyces sp. NPDC002144]|uniref:hypothetical protein n=1 Tax=Bacillaceae TaxID=186817 RepID=UPI00203E95D0|nr:MULTISPECIES: hypothetical protein [Niallia]MCM3032885.1 hypothetical protein [Niallia sp. MER 6]MDK8643949.1 hypothetical protein [Niallia taxi]